MRYGTGVKLLDKICRQAVVHVAVDLCRASAMQLDEAIGRDVLAAAESLLPGQDTLMFGNLFHKCDAQRDLAGPFLYVRGPGPPSPGVLLSPAAVYPKLSCPGNCA